MELMRRLLDRAKLAGDGGGSDDGGMLEQRVAHLERDVGEIKVTLGRMEALLAKLDARFDKFDERVRKLEVDVSGLRERAASMPTTWTMLGMIIAVTGLVLAVLRFGPRI
jgi:uncharacterized coiled-coil protein SlyX